VCNLGLISQSLSRYMDDYAHISIIRGKDLSDGRLVNTFFSGYIYGLYRLGQNEYENPEDPFPKGRIPFITIHQAKGLEFPVVVLGNPRKDRTQPQPYEKLVQPLLKRKGEPLDRMALFDARRMFYVALSRAKNLLIIAHYKGRGQRLSDPFKSMLDEDFPRIPDYKVSTLPKDKQHNEEIPRSYSYTSDYLMYCTCPRKYMIFRKYGFVPSRSQTMFFGNVVHQTIEDLHNYLISTRGKK